MRAVSGSQVNHLRAKKGSMKLAHIILLSSAGAATVLGAGAVAEKSAVSLGPHFSQAASELLGSPARWDK